MQTPQLAFNPAARVRDDRDERDVERRMKRR
jgi:hypothetical protein